MNIIIFLLLLLLILQISYGKDLLKWNIGNYYIVSGEYNSMINTITPKLDKTFLKGFSWIIKWNKFQQVKDGPFDFTVLDDLLNVLSEHNANNPGKEKSLFIRIAHTNWNDACTSAPIPTGVGWVKLAHKCVPELWNKEPCDALISLYQAIGERYDEHEWFEGLETGETAMSGAPDYTNTKYANQEARMVREVTPYFKYSRLSIFFNFLGTKWADQNTLFDNPDIDYEGMCDGTYDSYKYFCQIGDEVLKFGSASGHPDSPVDTVPGGGPKYLPGMIFQQRIKDQVVMALDCQTDILEAPDTEEAQFRKLISEFNANYVIWASWWTGYSGSRTSGNLYPNYLEPFFKKIEIMEKCYEKQQNNSLSSQEKVDCDSTHQLLRDGLNGLSVETRNYMQPFEKNDYVDWTFSNRKVPNITCSRMPRNTNCVLCPQICTEKTFVEKLVDSLPWSIPLIGVSLIICIICVSCVIVVSIVFFKKKKRSDLIKISSEIENPTSTSEIEMEK